MPDCETEATVREEVAPRSYTVETPEGTYRRTRRDIVETAQTQNTNELWNPQLNLYGVEESLDQ